MVKLLRIPGLYLFLYAAIVMPQVISESLDEGAEALAPLNHGFPSTEGIRVPEKSGKTVQELAGYSQAVSKPDGAETGLRGERSQTLYDTVEEASGLGRSMVSTASAWVAAVSMAVLIATVGSWLWEHGKGTRRKIHHA